MLCVRKISFIDRAEPEAMWTYNLKKQWSFGDLIAVRVRDYNERVLGSTIPLQFAAAQTGEAGWGVSWIDEDPVEKFPSPQHPAANDAAKRSAALQKPDDPSDEADIHASSQLESVENTAATPPFVKFAETDRKEAPQLPLSPAPDAAVPEGDAATVAAAASSTEEGQSPTPPTTAAAEKEREDATKSSEEPRAHVHDGSVSSSATTGPNPVKAAVSKETGAAAAATVAPRFPAPLSLNGDANGHSNAGSPSHASDAVRYESDTGPATSSTNPPPPPLLPADRQPRYSNCLPINIAQAAKGTLFLDVITASGTKLAVTEADVQAILSEDTSESPLVQHYAIVLTPLKAKPKEKQDPTIYAVLEFSVVVGTTDGDVAVAMSASARFSSVPTSLEVGSTCAFSTRTFYYPPMFLTGTGQYIVTNVLCVESRSDNPVRLEVALPEDLKGISVLPHKKSVISRRGGRAFFTFTWSVFDTYVNVDSDKDGDADHITVGMHVLICDGMENKAPVNIALVGKLPSPAGESTEPFLFYVNHAKVSNVACNMVDEAVLADILPISLVTRAGV